MTKAIILLSGGLDSAVLLALAIAQGRSCYAISFDYQQRHRIELQSAQTISHHYQVPHQIIHLDPAPFRSSALLAQSDLAQSRTFEAIVREGIPNTYVPARNTLFLAYALGMCEFLQAEEIHFGCNKMDHDSYPDCHPAYLEAFNLLAQRATKQAIEGRPPRLVTPFRDWDKKQIIQQGLALNVPLELTSSCYTPSQEGTACLVCDACMLRAEAFNSVFNTI